MIAELFYPKELKEVIADLRSKGDLNEEAVREFDYQINIRVIGMPLLASFFFYILEGYLGWIVAIFLIAGLWIDINNHYKSYIGAYINGKRRKSKVLEQISMVYFRKKIIVRDTDNEKKITIGPLREFWGNTKCPNTGETVFYFQDTSQRFQPMPDLDFVKQKYCLSLSTVKGEKL